MVRNNDGSFEVTCIDNSTETVKRVDILRDELCNSGQVNYWRDPDLEVEYKFMGKQTFADAKKMCRNLGPYWDLPKKDQFFKEFGFRRLVNLAPFKDRLLLRVKMSNLEEVLYKAMWENYLLGSDHASVWAMDRFSKIKKLVGTDLKTTKSPTVCVKTKF